VFGYTDRARIEQLARLRGRSVRVVDEVSAYVPVDRQELEPANVLPFVKSILRGV